MNEISNFNIVTDLIQKKMNGIDIFKISYSILTWLPRLLPMYRNDDSQGWNPTPSAYKFKEGTHYANKNDGQNG